METVKTNFIETFGQELADKVVECAEEHSNGVNSDNRGSDPFKWALLICIGYQCLEKYGEYHDIECNWDEVKKWIKEHGNLAEHEGDMDYLALFSGVYNEYMPKETI